MAKKYNFEDIPEVLLKVFGEPEFSFEFKLSEDKSMVKENPIEVLKNLQERGFHLQMPAENKDPH